MANEANHGQKPCPNCGHCPTCGRSNAAPLPYWPAYPYWMTPVPYVPVYPTFPTLPYFTLGQNGDGAYPRSTTTFTLNTASAAPMATSGFTTVS